MSSGTKSEPGRVRKMLSGLANRLTSVHRETMADAQSKVARLGLSPRQQNLNRLWAWYRCENYAARRFDWNGQPVSDPVEHEAIASAGYLPPGFYDAGSTFPLKFRKPSAPYALVRVVVDRFSGLLFSEKRNPVFRVDGDPKTEDYLLVLAETARLWPAMILARGYGGAMGSVAIGFQFVEGVPVIEVHDPRWMAPEFIDRSSLRLKSIEKRYRYPVEERQFDGRYEIVEYWYRRIIDDQSDTLFAPAPVGDGDEPDWQIQSKVDHGFGFCPVIWVQNLPVQDDTDGDPDCHGVYDAIESIDSLISQANRGIVANCDPTLVITSDSEMSEVKKGSNNAIKLEKGGSASYMEIAGGGPKAALEMAEVLRKNVLEVVQCILEHPDMSQRTATEIERAYSSMLAKADILREQYGQKCLIPLMDMMISAIRKLGEGRINTETGMIERQELVLPYRQVVDEDGNTIREAPTLGDGGTITLQWPHYFEALLSDVELATRAAIAAKAAGLVDKEHACKFIAEYFKVEDVHAMMTKVQQEQTEQQEALASQSLGMLNAPGIPEMGEV